MRTLFDGEVDIAYGQLYINGRVESEEEPDSDLDTCFAGQRVGLCGAAVPGFLYLIFGTNSGDVPLTVELHPEQPSVDLGGWEEIVEVSFETTTDDTLLAEWSGEAWDLGLPAGAYRVRYHCRGMDEAHDFVPEDDEPGPDAYLLQFWPAPPRRDRIVKETGRAAAYWHRFAAELPPPPTAEELAEAKRLAAAEKARRVRQLEAEAELKRWGGRPPSDRLRNVGGEVDRLVYRDPALVHAIDDAGPEVQRAIARWAAHRFCEATGLDGVGWIARGLAELDRGEPLSPPLDDAQQTWRRMFDDPRIREIIGKSLDRAAEAAKQKPPFPALTAAVHPDPLRAALNALAATAVGPSRRDLFLAVRETFPQVAHAPLPSEPDRSGSVRVRAYRRRADDR